MILARYSMANSIAVWAAAGRRRYEQENSAGFSMASRQNQSAIAVVYIFIFFLFFQI